MTDPDVRMWCRNGKEMTIIEIGQCPKASERRRKLTAWIDSHTTGEYTITPWLIGFEHSAEAILFKLAYK